jgi:hypothetical protein
LILCLTNYVLRPEDVWGVDVKTEVFLTLEIVRGELLASHLDRIILEGAPRAPIWVGVWVGPRSGLDDVEK